MLNNTGFEDRIENKLKTYLQDNEDNDDRNVNSEHVSSFAGKNCIRFIIELLTRILTKKKKKN